MRIRSLLAGTVSVCLLLVAACSDAVSPPASDRPLEDLQPSLAARQINILVEDPTAPLLEAYSFDFWVVQGVGRTVGVNYRPGSNGVANRFMRLVIPKDTRLLRPDGSPVAAGDSVRISVTIDTRQLLVQFGPDGLTFGNRPAQLRLHYQHAYLDLNADGVIDALDTEIVRTLLAIAYQPTAGAPWSIPGDQLKSLDGKYVEIGLPHFSNYAVAW